MTTTTMSQTATEALTTHDRHGKLAMLFSLQKMHLTEQQRAK